jgi:hypothetical protein
MRKIPAELRISFAYVPLPTPVNLEDKTHNHSPQRPRAKNDDEKLKRRASQNRHNGQKHYKKEKFADEQRQHEIQHWTKQWPRIEAVVQKYSSEGITLCEEPEEHNVMITTSI